MTNVVSMGATCEYLVSRAARHRRAGRYDEAMVLLTKARTQFGLDEEIELETARVYDEIGCEEEAAKCYLRVARMDGRRQSEALFSLALSSAQHADIERAVSFFQQFAAAGRQGVSEEMAVLLGRQLLEETERPISRSRKARVRSLERKAAQAMQQGKVTAAKRAIEHAIALCPTAQNHTLLACCCLLREEKEEAVKSAETAHRLAPARVQTICVLADAYMALGDEKQARRAIYLAAMRAKKTDDLLAAAIECAKYGEDGLTLRLTDALLRREPYYMRAMMLRACALANLGRLKQASRLFGRICGILPQDTVCEFFYRQTKEGIRPSQRLGLGLDVTREEGVSRAKTLISLLYCDPKEIDENPEQRYAAIRLCDWAMHSPMAGGQTKTVALIVLGALEAWEARELLLDLLTQPQIAESMKMAILQVLTSKEGFKPYLVDIGGRLVRLAAGGISSQPVKSGEANSRIVQRASDALSRDFPDAPQRMLTLYLEYLKVFGEPEKREEDALSAALECAYHIQAGREANLPLIARRCGVSKRLVGMYVRRMIGLDGNGCTTDREKDEEKP